MPQRIDAAIEALLSLQDHIVAGPLAIVLVTAVRFVVLWIANAVLLPVVFVATLAQYARRVTGPLRKPVNGRARRRLAARDHTILVTGGCGGIGRELVLEIATRLPGARIAILDRSAPKPAFALPDPPRGSEPSTVHVFQCDLADPAQLHAAFKQVVERVGPPTILVSCAGVFVGKTLADISAESLKKSIAVNLTAHLLLARLCLPGMVAGGYGHIVAVSSMLAFVPSTHAVDYCAAKAGLLGAHDAMHAEFCETGMDHLIRTTLVCPAHVSGTDMFSGFQYRLPWLCASLTPAAVARAIVFQLRREHVSHATLLFPAFAKLAPFVRLLPTDAVDWLDEIFGGRASIQRMLQVS